MNGPARFLAAAGLVAGLAAATGCVNDGPKPRQTVRPPAAQPSGAVVTVVDLAATRYARDSDKNGYADEVNATAFLFAPPHETPVVVPGEFRFSLLKLDGTVQATWSFDAAKSQAAVERLLPGPGYRFRLSLLDYGPDTFPSEDMQLWCVFRLTEGDPVQSRSPIRVTVGQLR